MQIDDNMKKNKIAMWPSSFFVEDNEIWFVHGKINALMKYDICEKRTIFIGMIPNEKCFGENLYSFIYKYKNYVLMIPSWGREIAVYDISKKRMRKICIQEIDKYNGKSLFLKGFVYKNYLYCVPCSYQAIIRIDLDTLEYKDYEYGIKYFRNELQNGKVYGNSSALLGMNKFICAYPHWNKIFCFDMETETMSLIEIGEEDWRYTSIACIGTDVFLFENTRNRIIKYSMDSKAILQEYPVKNGLYYRLDNLDLEHFIADEVTHQGYIIFDTNLKEIFIQKYEPLNKKSTLSYSYCTGKICHCLDKYFYFDTANERLYKWDGEKMTPDISFQLDVNMLDSLKQELSEKIELIDEENELVDLKFYILCLKELHKENNPTNYGSQIYDFLC